MNNLIAESMKRFNDLARKEIKHYDNMCDRGDFCICLQDVQADFLKQELQAIAEKTREETAKEIFGTMDEWPLCRNIADNIERYTDFRDAFLSDKESK